MKKFTKVPDYGEGPNRYQCRKCEHIVTKLPEKKDIWCYYCGNILKEGETNEA